MLAAWGEGVQKKIALACLIGALVLVPAAWAAPFDPLSLARAAEKQVGVTNSYDSHYHKIAYPGGDVPMETGVCADVVIRAYREVGADLQQLMHEDMAQHFSLYPKIWGLTAPDSNIDHRRVPNLQVFFTRFGQSIPVSDKPEDYKPGDIVTWDIGNIWRTIVKGRSHIPHIGIVTNKRSKDATRPLMVHNIGYGAKIEDVIFDWAITGHYRYAPERRE
jgi:uncharacterized protein YijF (DUF1287 family)